MLRLSAIVLASILLVGCAKHSGKVAAPEMPTATLSSAPEITSESESGFHDFVFRVEERHPDKRVKLTRFLRASGTYHGKPLAFGVVWGAKGEWPASKDPKIPVPMFSDFVFFDSIGPESDLFATALATEYGVATDQKKMIRQVATFAVSLAGDPRVPEKGPVKLKLFFKKGSDEDYGEIFLNLDVAHSRLELKEKDASYRKNVVECLTAK